MRTNDIFGEAGYRPEGGWVMKGNRMQMSPPPLPHLPPLLLQHSTLIQNQYDDVVSVRLQEWRDRQTRMKWEKVDDGWGVSCRVREAERARETVEGGREGGKERYRVRWFIKHLEGWRADRPLHFSPLTVQEIGDWMLVQCVFMCVCFLLHWNPGLFPQV